MLVVTNNMGKVLKRWFGEVFRISVAIAILPVFWPVAILTVTVLLSVRYVIQFLLNLLHGRNVYNLVSSSSSDGIFGHKTFGNSAIIHSVTVLKGDPDLEKIRDRYRTHVFTFTDPVTGRKNVYEKLKWNLTTKLGFHCWHNVSDSFDIRQQVRYLDMIRPNEVFTEDKVMRLMGKLMSQDLSACGASKPQWEHLIIPNYRLSHENVDSRPTHFVSLFRVHHAYSDGASFAILMDSVLADRPLKYAMHPLKPFKGMTWWKQAWINFKALTVGPLDFLLTLASSVVDSSPLIMRKYSREKFVDWSRPLNLDFLKEIKSVSGASLASILVSAVTRSLKDIQERLEMDKLKNRKRSGRVYIPENIRIGNMVVMLPYPSREMQNHFTTFSVPYPLAEENLIRRLTTSDRIGRSYMGSSEPWFHFYVMRFSAICPKVLQDILLELPAAPIVFSNIPGIKEPYQLFDRELMDVGAWLPLFKAFGMAISTYSYCDKLRICVTCDSKLLGSQAHLKTFIRSIEERLFDMAKFYNVRTERLRPHTPTLKNTNHNQYHFSEKLYIRRLSATRLKANG